MSKYVNNAIVFLTNAVILVLCIGTYLGADTISDISKEIVEALPFGKYAWEMYSMFNNPSYAQSTTQIFNQSVLFTIRDFFQELAKLTASWFIYRLVMRNAVSILMVAYCDGSSNIWDRLKSEVFYNIGFVISSLLSNYLLVFTGNLFQSLGDSLLIIWLQIASYGIFTVGGALIICLLLYKLFFKQTLLVAVIEGFARLILCISFLFFIDYLKYGFSYQIGVIIILAIGVTLITDSIK